MIEHRQPSRSHGGHSGHGASPVHGRRTNGLHGVAGAEPRHDHRHHQQRGNRRQSQQK